MRTTWNLGKAHIDTVTGTRRIRASLAGAAAYGVHVGASSMDV